MSAFQTSLSWEVEAIVSLISIYIHLDKISGRHHLRVLSLPQHHLLNSLLDKHYSKKTKHHQLSIGHLIYKQCSKIMSSIVDTNNCLNEVFSFFDRLHKELSSGFWLVDNFPDWFSFYTVNIEAKNAYWNKLDKIFNEFSSDTKTVLIIFDASIKNNAVTSISHIYNIHNIIAKTLHYTINIISIKADLFSIRCKINQAIQVPNVKQIIVITDTIPATRHIFNLSSYLLLSFLPTFYCSISRS